MTHATTEPTLKRWEEIKRRKSLNGVLGVGVGYFFGILLIVRWYQVSVTNWSGPYHTGCYYDVDAQREGGEVASIKKDMKAGKRDRRDERTSQTGRGEKTGRCEVEGQQLKEWR